MTIAYERRDFASTYAHSPILDKIARLRLEDQRNPDAEVFRIFQRYSTFEIRRACLKRMESLWLICGTSLEWMCGWAEDCIRQLTANPTDPILSDLLNWYVGQSTGSQRIRAINFVLAELYFDHEGLGSKQLASALKNSDRAMGDIRAQTYQQIPLFEKYVLSELNQMFDGYCRTRDLCYSDSDWHRVERAITVMLSYSQATSKLVPTFIAKLEDHLTSLERVPLLPQRLDTDQAYIPELKAAQHLAILQTGLCLLIAARQRQAQNVL